MTDVVLTNCTTTQVQLSKVLTSSTVTYVLAGEVVVAPGATRRFRTVVGMDAGPITVDAELVSTDGATHRVRARGSVRGVMIHYVE